MVETGDDWFDGVEISLVRKGEFRALPPFCTAKLGRALLAARLSWLALMVNIRLNAGSTTIGRHDLPGDRVEVGRQHAQFCCSAEGVTVATLGRNQLGVATATG